MIVFDKLFEYMEQNNITQTSLYRNAQLWPTTFAHMKNNEPVRMNSINRICNYLKCTPQDIMEYVPTKEYIRKSTENNGSK